MRIIGGDDAPGTECAHVEPHRGRTRAAVVEKSHRALRVLAIGFEVRDVEHAGFGGLIFGVLVRIILRDVVPTLGMNDESAGVGVVSDRISAYGDGAFAGLLLGLEVFRRLSRFRLADRRLGCCLRVNDRRMKRRDRNRGEDPQNKTSYRATLWLRNHRAASFHDVQIKEKYTGGARGRNRFSARRNTRESQGSGDYVRVVAKSGEPVHVRLLAEPGDLTLGEAARG